MTNKIYKKIRILSLIFFILLIGGVNTSCIEQKKAAIVVLVDMSGSWHSPKNKVKNKRNIDVLHSVGQGIAKAVRDGLAEPITITYYAIGTKSKGKQPLCKVTYSPKMFCNANKKNKPKEIANNKKNSKSKSKWRRKYKALKKGVRVSVCKTKQLEKFLSKTCPMHISKLPTERYTDISSAFLDQKELITQQADRVKIVDASIKVSKIIFVLSDMVETRRNPRDKGVEENSLDGFHVHMIYRVLPDFKKNSTDIEKWKTKLTDAKAELYKTDDRNIDHDAVAQYIKNTFDH